MPSGPTAISTKMQFAQRHDVDTEFLHGFINWYEHLTLAKQVLLALALIILATPILVATIVGLRSLEPWWRSRRR